MRETARHCPFLNRDDDRCSSSFQVGRLDHAFRHCFGNYAACPSYLELLVERRIRRSQPAGACRDTDAFAAHVSTVPLTLRGRPLELASDRAAHAAAVSA
jgi:hypothetical protein